MNLRAHDIRNDLPRTVRQFVEARAATVGVTPGFYLKSILFPEAPAAPMIHELKTDPASFQNIAKGIKTFELRKDDRGFEAGHMLCLRETRHTAAEMQAGQPLIYTGQTLNVRVTHLLRGHQHGIADGWVTMSIKLLT